MRDHAQEAVEEVGRIRARWGNCSSEEQAREWIAEDNRQHDARMLRVQQQKANGAIVQALSDIQVPVLLAMKIVDAVGKDQIPGLRIVDQ